MAFPSEPSPAAQHAHKWLAPFAMFGIRRLMILMLYADHRRISITKIIQRGGSHH
ncbi:hypothetical protein C8R48DRAFT_765391 [Suillus tomentosus]|nr:hypothetical protein C8R48DRAFT_765391 [Suillus tomentosus]